MTTNCCRWLGLAAVFLAVTLIPAGSVRAQCPESCPTSDDVALQALLDAAAAAGGGVVQLEARVYTTCEPLIIPSNTHLRGAGRGSTIIRGSATINAETIENSYVASSIATVATTNVTVSDLTVDHLTCSRHANGVSFLPAGTSPGDVEAYDGQVATNGLVERVEVLGYPGVHSYMIWNMRGQHIKILNNWVDGGSTSTSAQEGIESFGGHDVVISGNTVKNIGYACLNVGSAGLPNSETSGISMTKNYLTNCDIGVNLGTSNADMIPQMQSFTRVIGNFIIGVRKIGIDVLVAPGTTERDLLISGNTIRDIDVSGAAGIMFRSPSGQPLPSDGSVGNTVQGNHIENVRGSNAHGIRIWTYPNVRVLDNTITGVDSGGVYVVDSNDLEIVGNRFDSSGTSAIQLWKLSTGCERFIIDRNRIEWPGLSGGILLVGNSRGTVKDNVLTRKDAATPTPVVAANTCGVTATGNVAWYHPTWAGLVTPACQ